MKIVIAIDSFKGSVSSLEAGEAVRKAAHDVFNDAEIVVLPLADGGEGTSFVLTQGMGGYMQSAKVRGPLGNNVTAKYGVVPEAGVAIIEMAQAAGIELITPELRDPMLTSTFGVGEMIVDAMNRGYRKFIVGLGGSCTNDAGLGMLSAMGYSFYDKDGNPVGVSGKDTALVASIDISGADPRLKDCEFRLASDVKNPLCGEQGATMVFGWQKGATPETAEYLDKGLRAFAEVSGKALGSDYSNWPGAGAAGGLGYAFLAYLNATIHSGIDLVLDTFKAEMIIQDADMVITGEGKLDAQTLMGKAPAGIAGLAKKYNHPVIALAGVAEREAQACNGQGIDAFFSIQQGPVSIEEAMDIPTASENLYITAKQVFNVVKAMQS